MEARAKIIFDKALRLSKYDTHNSKKVFKKGLVKKDSLTRAEYKHMVDELLHQVSALDPYQAQRVSTIIRANPEAEKTITKLKEFNRTIENDVAKEAPPASNPNLGNDGESVSVLFIDVASRFERIEAIFTGTRLTELYADDAYHRKCEEIELLLEGRDAEKPQKRDVGQMEQLAELAELLKVCVPNRSSSLPHAPPNGTVPNTARGAGPSWVPPVSARGEPGSSGFMETPRGGGGIDVVPKCLTARRAAEESGAMARGRMDFQMQQPIYAQPGPSMPAQAHTVQAQYSPQSQPQPQYSPQNQSPQYSNPLQPAANIDPFAEPMAVDPFSAPSFPDTVKSTVVEGA